ncbi:hypothetical protein JCGZ_01982 [Jatropha curcas]|uniref:Clp R domain-containing protein n=1 Tax=Jatropha curcas TaxID=180498 RepID=A0A067JS03_JATCU|nr:hypothetical protein JCGZ_01982 [Jatropha curcas]
MRAGICSVQQTLTAEAASIIKQAFSLARRRGHAQVTPLHVASAMLASSNGLLRRACLQSHSHPLQCKALELCFNVALNRLPASTSSALLGPHSSFPSLSNALVAAFKRAQAHQRRGSVENQQQPILALKIEIEQLIISILDDPSVSRVMREAGFSSTQVKNKVEQHVSLEICSQSTNNTPASCQSKEITKPQVFNTKVSQTLPFSTHQFGVTLSKQLDEHPVSDDDVMSVLNTLAHKKRNTVITGESIASVESVVRGVLDKIERGLAPGELRSVRFISFPLFSLRDLSKEEVEQRLVELRCIANSYICRGVILYLGDLKWVSDFWSNYGEQSRNCCFSIENIIMEIKRLVRGIGENGRIWLLGTGTFQTYMKCKAGHPSLETIWELYPLAIPVGSLSLSLNLDSDWQSQTRSKVSKGYGYSWPLLESAVDTHLTSCTDCSVNFNRDAHSIGCRAQNKEFITTNLTVSTSSSLPSWLQQHKEDTKRIISDDKECTDTSHLPKKWESFCNAIPQKTIKFASSPPSPISISSHECNTSLNRADLSWPIIFEPQQFSKEQKFWMSECKNIEGVSKPDLLSNPNSSPNSASSSEAMDDDTEGLQSFKEFNDQNLKILCNSLEKKVPWQKEIIPEIATTVLECRSNKKCKWNCGEEREETWLFFLGLDSQGKEKIARELARLVFGSQANYVSIGASNFSSTRADSTEETKKKRARDELGCSYYERFGLALNENPHRVFFIEDAEQIDYSSQKGIKKAIEIGRVTLAGGENVPLKDAIVIFSCESFSSVSRACSPSRRVKTCESEGSKDKEDKSEERKEVISLDLNIAIKIEDEDQDEYSNMSENRILQSVDRQIIFKIQEL